MRKSQATLSEICEQWLQEKSDYVKPTTISAYQYLVHHYITPHFRNKRMFTENNVQEYCVMMHQTGLSNKTISDILMVIRMINRYGAKCSYWKHQKWDIHLCPGRKTNRIQVLSAHDHKRLLDYVTQQVSPKATGIYLSLTMGLRMGEVCGLKWSDIDMREHILHVRRTVSRMYGTDTKGNKTILCIGEPKTQQSMRDIPVHPSTMKILSKLYRPSFKNFFVVSNCERPIDPRTYRSYFKRLMTTLEMPDIRFHDLRHSFATRCLEQMCDYKTVSSILGHANITTTLNLYVHPDMTQKRKCLNRMMSFSPTHQNEHLS